MRISTKGRYALRMLLDLAEYQQDGYIPLKDIAERQGISKKYLEQIVTLLHQSDLLKTNRGHKGGYRLGPAPSDCTVGQVLRITEGSLNTVACLENGQNGCERGAFCPTLPVWRELDELISNYLDGITLQDILDRYGKAEPFCYCI